MQLNDRNRLLQLCDLVSLRLTSSSSRIALGAASIAALSMLAHAQLTQRVSLSTAGAQGDSDSYLPAVSPDGRYVAFTSYASTLVAGDTGGFSDVFVHDLVDGTTERVSVSSAGVQGDHDSADGQLSSDGRWVVFDSFATNLVAGDTNAHQDVFLRDRATGTTTRVSVDSSGVQGNADSQWPTISADGRYVCFYSQASNLVAGDTNGQLDCFVRDVQTGQTTRVSVDSSGSQANSYSYYPSISGDGRYVCFFSDATNLVANDTNLKQDVFVHDRQTGATTRVSVDSAGGQANGNSTYPWIATGGGQVVFFSDATNLIAGDTNGLPDAFVHDLASGATTRVSIASGGAQANGATSQVAISGDGRYVAFFSSASNLVTGDTNATYDIFLRDRVASTTTRVSVDSAGAQANSYSQNPALSFDGRTVAFASAASNLVVGDTDGFMDVFVRTDCPGATSYCTAKTNSLGCTPAIGAVGFPSASAGSGFEISASNVLNNKNGLFFYGTSGQQAVSFQGGTLCVRHPLRRTPVQMSNGNAGPNDCSGSYAIDFNAYIASGADPLLVAGAAVDGQYWSRDPGFTPPNSTGLTNAIHFSICP